MASDDLLAGLSSDTIAVRDDRGEALAERPSAERDRVAVPRREPLTRRQLIGAGAALAALPWLDTAAMAQQLMVPEAAAGPSPLSVGYLPPSQHWRNLKRMPWEAPTEADAGKRLRIVSAADLPLGDQQLAGEAVRFRVHGVYPRHSWGASTARSGRLVVRFPEPSPRVGPVPFTAWAFRLGRAPFFGSPVSFVVPLGINGELDIELELERRATAAGSSSRPGQGGGQGGGSVPQQLRTTFTVDWQSGVPKLKRGVYFLALERSTWRSAVTIPADRDSTRADLRSLVVSVDTIRRV